MLKLLKKFTKTEVALSFAALFFIILQVWMDLTMPDYMSQITTLVQTEGSAMGEILAAGGMMLACALGSFAAAACTVVCVAKIAANSSAHLRELLFHKVQSFTMGEIGQFSTASLITRSTNDVMQVQMFVVMGLLGMGFMGVFLALESYRLERIAIWRNPEDYEKGYQTLQGLYAIGSGGLFGRGLGNSVQKLGFLPEAQNDMIFSIICEELGLAGASVIVLLFLVLIWRFFVIATKAKDLLGALIASGAMAHMMIQVILNIAVVTNTIPNTGITLPFISYGGTSVVFLLLEMGLVLSVSNLIE